MGGISPRKSRPHHFLRKNLTPQPRAHIFENLATPPRKKFFEKTSPRNPARRPTRSPNLYNQSRTANFLRMPYEVLRTDVSEKLAPLNSCFMTDFCFELLVQDGTESMRPIITQMKDLLRRQVGILKKGSKYPF
jgi:hypothetical protein